MDAIVIDGESVSDAADVTANATAIVITVVLTEPAATITIAAATAITTTAAIPETVSAAVIQEMAPAIPVPLTMVAVIIIPADATAAIVPVAAGAIVPVSAMDTIRDIRMAAMPVATLAAMPASCLLPPVTVATAVIKQSKTKRGVNLKKKSKNQRPNGRWLLLSHISPHVQASLKPIYLMPGPIFCHAPAFSFHKNIG